MIANKPPAYLATYRRILPGELDSILELGIETGGSLLLWRDWYPTARISGLDRILPTLDVDVAMYQGEQDDRQLLRRIGEERGPFDLIVDDCSHRAAPTKAAFWFLWQYLVPGGTYAIEDWGTGYWADFGDNAPGMVGFIKELVDECGRNDRERRTWAGSSDEHSRFRSLTVEPGLALVVKA